MTEAIQHQIGNGLTGKWYYFDASGWMVTGWQKEGDNWYYLYNDGVMASDTWIGEDYVDATGAWRPEILKEKWISSGEKWWYRHSDGSYTTSNWEWINGKWYYFDASGWMMTGWQKVGNEWYYCTVTELWQRTVGLGRIM